MEQVETILKNFPETSQRSILGECRRDAFMQQEQIQWEAKCMVSGTITSWKTSDRRK